jgi:uncharacterized protein YggU (UPF0235/DUF167 family)
LRVPPSRVELVSGAASRNKAFEVEGVDVGALAALGNARDAG